jgi:HEPN domain-containing protein
LKALLVLRQVDFPRTHDLGTLLRLCDAAGYRGMADFADVVTLTRYAVASRYPGETDPVGHDDAQTAADLAKQVLAWVETHIIK